MPKISYTIKYNKNRGLIMSPTELINLYFYGVGIESNDGTMLSEETILMYIKAAMDEIEKYLDIKLIKTFVEENIDYYRDSYIENMPLLVTSYFLNEALSMIGRLGSMTVVKYPRSWLSIKHSNQDQFRKQLRVIPTGTNGGAQSGQVLISGMLANTGVFGYRTIPNYFTVQYITGFEKMPFDILNVVGKLAAIGLFNIAGDLILGAGIASMSLGIDGLSQSVSATSSATNSGYGSRIVQYHKEIKDTLTRLKKNYKTINLTVL